MPGAPLAVGFFGKIPSTGDFVATGLPRGFIDRWDRWMSMELARRPNDEAYDAYGWRFRVRAGLFGELPASGVWRISADRVGRPYPFTIAAGLPAGFDIADAPAACTAWLSRAESLAADACRAGADVEGLPARLAILGRPEPERVSPATRALLDRLSGPLRADASLWWTRGGGRIAPSLLSCPGLPATPRPTAFLDGAWTRWGWENADEG